MAHYGINTLNVRKRHAPPQAPKTTELRVFECAALVALRISLASLGLSVPAESLNFGPLRALRQSCTG